MIDFRPDRESSLTLGWVNLSGLPIPLFDRNFLLKLGGLIGRSLKIDEATASLKRPPVARMLIEVDVQNDLRTRL